jgi:5,10-methylenetetrahydrofolate reductase
MKLNYELNPPRILNKYYFDISHFSEEILHFTKRAAMLAEFADGIHITDSVLGIARLSSITGASYVKRLGTPITISCSLRVRDRNLTSISQFVCDAILVGVQGLLILAGDRPSEGPQGSDLKPSEVLNMLHNRKYDSFLSLNLSVPHRIKHVSSVQRKLDARPNAFVTQSIVSLSDLGEIVDIAKPFKIKVVACIMVPSQKNISSANAIGLNWKEYVNNPVDFVLQAGKIANEVLLTSPNSFLSGLDLLKELKRELKH